MRLTRKARWAVPTAAVIVAGGVIALAVLEWAGSARVCISDRGVRWGLAEELSSSGPTLGR